MSDIRRGARSLLDHTTAAILFLALVLLTLLGRGNVTMIGMLGLLLCAAGLNQRSVKVDLWIFLPLLIYNAVSMLSSFTIYGNILLGYSSTQIILPLFFLLTATLNEREYLLLRQLCAAWVEIVALQAIAQFAYTALTTGSRRLSGWFGNPNVMGIFLVIGWFMLISIQAEEKKPSGWTACLRYGEPVVLIALSLTLSMGSFLSLAVGAAVLALLEKKRGSWHTAACFVRRTLAKAGLCMGTGLLAYLAASRTDAAWSCLLALAYGGWLTAWWPGLLQFLENRPRVETIISAAGVLSAAAAVLMRPSSAATFTERLAMMRNGLGYLFLDPLLGVGPYQRRILNMYDSDKYFNTYYIHNVLIHTGVELGLIAMTMLIVVAVRYWSRGTSPARRGGFMAFFFHCMMDTGFLYPGVITLAMLSADSPSRGGKTMRLRTFRCFLAGFAVVFAVLVIGSIARMAGGKT